MDLAKAIAETAEPMRRLIDGVDPAQLAGGTPCADFDVRALVGHIVGTAPYATAAVTGTDFVPVDFDDDTFKAVYARELDRMVDAWAEPGALDGEVSFGAGSMPASRAAAIVVHELVLHGWDLATATGQPFDVSDDIAQFVYSVVEGGVSAGGRDRGTYGPEVAVSADASALDRALGMSGRDPNWSA